MDIVRQHQQEKYVNVIALAKELGIRVYTTDEWNENISGSIIKNKEFGGDSGYACFINANHSKTRRYFTIAHEIAHFILHREQVGDGITDDALFRSSLSSRIETEANKLAANILMPWHLIHQALNEGKKTIPELADFLKVSKNAMSIRLGVPFED